MMPGKGEVLSNYKEPVGDGIRCDSAGWYTGLKPNQMYDPLVGKLICSVPNDQHNFEGARNLALKCLEDFKIEGIANNIDAVKRILTHSDFIANKVNTSFLVEYPELLNPKPGSAAAKPKAAAARATTAARDLAMRILGSRWLVGPAMASYCRRLAPAPPW